MKTIIASTLLVAGLLLSAPSGNADGHKKKSYHQFNSRGNYSDRGYGFPGAGYAPSYPAYGVQRESHGAYSPGYRGYGGGGYGGGHGYNGRSSQHNRNRGISIDLFGF